MHFEGDPDQHLVDAGSRMDGGEFKIRFHHLHRVSARWIPTGRFDVTPAFHGHVEREVNGFTVAGTVREMRSRAILPFTFLLLVACGVALLFAGFTYPDDAAGNGTILLVLGFILAPLFGILFITELRRRRPRFRREAAELESGLQTYLRTGRAEKSAH